MRSWKNNRSYGWIIGTLAGIAFLVIGIAQDQLTAVWQKAVMICLDCIGIG